MRKFLAVSMAVAFMVIVSPEEIFFGGKFVLHYSEDFYSLSWLKDYVSKLRSLHNLETEDRFVKDLKRAIDTASARTGLDPLLIIAVITVESEFRNVIGMAGELGMMQIKPSTAEFVSGIFKLPVPRNWKDLLWNYELNIMYGACYLKYLLDKFGNLRKALEYYNGGYYRKEYAEKIITLYEELKLGSLR